MEATPTLVINYYSGFKQNVVPLFQRPYTWSEKQWRTLWDDVMVFYPAEDTDDKATHFMGAVVTMSARSVPVGVSKFLIIDGQQRLTTISILMCAVRDMLRSEQQVARRRIQQFYLTNDGCEGTEFFKLLPTHGDRAAYASLIQESDAPSVDSQFKKAYDYFRRRLRSENDEGEKIEPKRILDIIEKRLMVVMINLSDTDDPYLIFESLNFKGSPLEQSDLVRNYFLMRFTVTDQQGIYDGLWLPMQNRLGQGLTEFMRHFLGAEGEEVRKGDVYTAVRRLVADSDSASVRILMIRMERLSTMYSRLSGTAGEPHPELNQYFDYFRRLDFGSVYPLLLSLYEDYADGQFALAEFVSSMGILLSFILRRMVVGVPSNSLSGLFITLFRSKPVTETPSAWLSTSLARENKNRRWPTDAEFEERWVRSDIYGGRACQVILERLEQSYGHHEVVSFDESSIEHIMPQTLTPEWYELLGADAADVHSEWLHTIGNLTLTGYNPELSNRSYSEKRGLFATSHFELNRHFGDHENWSAFEIEARARGLFKIAVKLWPRPEVFIIESPIVGDKGAPAAFHGECIKLAQRHLGTNLSKLSQTRYESGDGRTRLMCAVSATHKESGDIPYFWFALHRAQVDFLDTAESPYVCFGCASAETTLLVPLSVIRGNLDSMSVTKTGDRDYWHIVIQKKQGKFVIRLLGGKDGPDLTNYNIGGY
ncbi:MAG TPA: DUF262 domain-containing protein [Candidatus Angelobacter sp.]|jgi:hypothetical protein|nr:DUF262 domain-containing protein [Candidatus Angelobacter sp.]